MYRSLLCLALCSFTALTLHAADLQSGDAKPKTRVHNAEFVMPDGWFKTGDEYGNYIMVPPGLKKTERCEISIGPFDSIETGSKSFSVS